MSIFFVGGGPRSGQSLLYRVLCSDEQAHEPLAEAAPLRALIEAYRFTKEDLHGTSGDYFSSLNDLRAFYTPLVWAFVERLRERVNATHLVLKESLLTTLFLELAELSADARFILIVRDPRDSVASMIQAGDRFPRRQGHGADTTPAEALAFGLNDLYFPDGLDAVSRFGGRALVVRYEQLVCAPRRALSLLRGFTGLSLEEIEPTGPNDNTWMSAQFGRRYSPKSIGHYKRTLSPEQITAVERVCAASFGQFGYVFTTDANRPTHAA